MNSPSRKFYYLQEEPPDGAAIAVQAFWVVMAVQPSVHAFIYFRHRGKAVSRNAPWSPASGPAQAAAQTGSRGGGWTTVNSGEEDEWDITTTSSGDGAGGRDASFYASELSEADPDAPLNRSVSITWE